MKRIPHSLAVAVVFSFAGCASVPTHYYTLGPGLGPGLSAAQYNSGPSLQHGVVVSTTSIPDLVDRLQLVVRESSTRVDIAESHQWAQPLRDQIPDIIVRNLRLELGTPNVVEDARLLAGPAPLKVVVNIEQFEATPGVSVTVSARWAITGGSGGGTGGTSSPPVIGELSSTQAISNGGFDTIVDAWSKALASISAAIAKSLQTADAR